MFDQYNALLSELKSHRDWLLDAESGLDVVHRTPLPEHIDALQRQLNSIQVSTDHTSPPGADPEGVHWVPVNPPPLSY